MLITRLCYCITSLKHKYISHPHSNNINIFSVKESLASLSLNHHIVLHYNTPVWLRKHPDGLAHTHQHVIYPGLLNSSLLSLPLGGLGSSVLPRTSMASTSASTVPTLHRPWRHRSGSETSRRSPTARVKSAGRTERGGPGTFCPTTPNTPPPSLSRLPAAGPWKFWR